MRLFQYQSIDYIARVFFAIFLLQCVAATVEAKALDLGESFVLTNHSRDLLHDVNKTDFALSIYSPTHAALDKQAVNFKKQQIQAEYDLDDVNGLSIYSIDKNYNACEECKSHGGHLVFTAIFNFVASHPFTVLANTKNSQYLPPAILLSAKPPITI